MTMNLSPIKPTFYFIGVSTGQSSMQRIFPRWMEALGRPEVAFVGIDFALHSPPAEYRQAVAAIKRQPFALGALVTSHKIDLFDASFDLFDELDSYAQLCLEISCISKQNRYLIGHATDPITSGRTLRDLLGDSYFGHTGAHVLCFGAGGAATATILHLINQPDGNDRPEKITMVDVEASRLSKLRGLVDSLHTDIKFEYICTADPQRNDGLLVAQPPHTLVINATGLGKDRPGSPISDAGIFPRQAVVWEFNYRGDLQFLRQAQLQQETRQLRIEDGWRYFLYGWTAVLEHVLDISITPALFTRLSEIAASAR